MGKEVLYINPNLHTGHIIEAAEELLDLTLEITRREETLLDKSAKIIGPASVTAETTLAVFRIPLPGRTERKWSRKENWVGNFLYSAKIIHSPERLDRRLKESLSSLDPDDPDTAERFLFGSRERIKYLLEGLKKHRLDTLRYGAYAYIESRVLRMATTEGVFLTKQTA